jgi:hypothetical protein
MSSTDGTPPDSPALGQGEERADRLGRLAGRHVHGERHELPGQGEHDHLGDGLARLVLGLDGGGAEVGRGHHRVELEQGRLSGGLDRPDVDGGTGHDAVLDGGGEGRLVDDPAPGHVDDPQPRLGLGQQRRVEQPGRLRRLRHVQRDEVRPLHQLLEREQLDAHGPGPVGRDVGVERHELHAEGVGPLRHERADAAEADDAEDLAVELDALPLRPLPLPGLQRGVGLGHVAGLGQQERHRVLGRRQDVRLRRVDDHHAPAGGRLDVDVVQADAGPADHHEVGPGLQHVGRDRRRRADDQGVGTLDRDQQLLR